ncbi:MAG: hypothetical protein WKF96_20580 [Solirubrobacteraceae bacterium]
MTTKTGISMRLPAVEREQLDRLATALGCSRTLLLRAAFSELTAADLSTVRQRLTAMPTGRGTAKYTGG